MSLIRSKTIRMNVVMLKRVPDNYYNLRETSETEFLAPQFRYNKMVRSNTLKIFLSRIIQQTYEYKMKRFKWQLRKGWVKI